MQLPHSPIPIKDQIQFFRLLAKGLGAGLSLSQSLGLISDGKGRSPLDRCVQRLYQRVKAGDSLGDALAAEPVAPFSPWVQALIVVGEYSGALDRLCDQVVTLLETQRRQGRSQRSAAWSLILCVMGAGAVVGILGRWNLGLMGLGVVALGGGTVALLLAPGLQPLRLQVPVLKGILQTQSMVQLAQLALPLECGVPIISALELLQPHIPHPTLRAIVGAATVQVKGGKTLTESLEGRLPARAVQYVRTGEASGTLPEMLAKMGEFYGEQLELRLQQALGVLRPLSLLGGGAIVLFLGLDLIQRLLGTLPG
ncbi:type II secretion system F family protein [Prochlorothrix hollandica]|uniref:type II secretion system F family protein n=1 Tax=Prochlorothrix hollandica TaxID=1223 RepID=UPI003342899D